MSSTMPSTVSSHMSPLPSPNRPAGAAAPADEVAAWAASGLMALTGPADGPGLGPPAGFVAALDALARRIERAVEATAELPTPLTVDATGRLTERAAIAGLGRHGTTSCGGGTRLLPAIDGWIAVTLARDDDVDLVPAWLGADLAVDPRYPWPAVTVAVSAATCEALVERGRLLGLPVAALPTMPPDRGPVVVEHVAAPATTRRDGPLRVLDLSALWAGPLCGALLAGAGAEVTKVESTARPDGARRGPAAFFDRLNGAKRSVALDLGSPDGIGALRRLLATVDVVVEASRPRALDHLGLDPAAVLAAGGPRVWISITGHGRAGAGRDRVAFGDDAAVAGGLCSGPRDRPTFCADAVADPLTGLVAAEAALAAWAAGRPAHLDISMAAVAAHFAAPTLAVPPDVVAADPPPVAPTRRAPVLGQHTTAVFAALP